MLFDLLNVHSIAFVVLGYPMSYVELIGTILYLWSVFLIARRQVLTWPIGIVSVLFYMALFYQIRLYSDTVEQFYYLGASIYGWYIWRRSPQAAGRIVDVHYSTRREVAFWVAGTGVAGGLTGLLMSRIHILAPAVFPEAASFPYLDATTTVMSFVGMWLMARKRTESWVYWIIVDVIAVGLYFVKDVKFVSLLYVILLIIAANGLRTWHSASRRADASTLRMAN